jgi:hypothetical protein
MVESKYEKYLVRTPKYDNTLAKNNTKSAMVYMSESQVFESSCYLDYRWISKNPEAEYILPEKSNSKEQIILFIGGDPQNPEDLGGEIEITLNNQNYIVKSTAALYLPQGLKCGPMIWKKWSHPHIIMIIVPSIGTDNNNSSDTSKVDIRLEDLSKSSFEKYLIRKPIYERGAGVKNRQSPTMTFVSSAQIPEANYYIEFGWIYGIPDPNPPVRRHVHVNDELILHFGMDWNNPEDLGGEIDFAVEEDHLISSTNTAFFAPKGLYHCPVTWRKVVRPHIEMAITLGSNKR